MELDYELIPGSRNDVTNIVSAAPTCPEKAELN